MRSIIKGCITFEQDHVFGHMTSYHPIAFSGDIEEIIKGRDLSKMGCHLTKKLEADGACLFTKLKLYGKTITGFNSGDICEISLTSDIQHTNVAHGPAKIKDKIVTYPDLKLILTENDRRSFTLYSLTMDSPPAYCVADDLIRDTLLNQEFEQYRESCQIISQ